MHRISHDGADMRGWRGVVRAARRDAKCLDAADRRAIPRRQGAGVSGSAVRLLEDVEAAQIDDALDALSEVLEGQNVDHRFADLIDREPELPEFLR